MKRHNSLPVTRLEVSPVRQRRIRQAVRSARSMVHDTTRSRLARAEDATALSDFLSDPAIHSPIYSLPTDLGPDSLTAFILDHVEQQQKGEGLLFIRMSEQGQIVGYSDLKIWPEWAAGELGGALHPRLQNKGAGTQGAKQSFNWMFSDLELDLICETAAPDNIRTARLLETLGFQPRGNIQSQRPDGRFRTSVVWEMWRADWLCSDTARTAEQNGIKSL